MNSFFDFITGGFFNYLGAAWRKMYLKEKYSLLVKENLSNSYGMLIMTVILFIFFILIKLLA
ncbi:MAG: hypothetical protein HYZ15_07815 [Sphingobacteriales bacterium]|nr:hypothetical protein [Sphingobacteriales bacterium]